MGWTGTYTDRPAKEVIAEDLNFTRDNGNGGRIIDMATKLNVTYVAYERFYGPDAGIDSNKRFVIGVVVLHRRRAGEFVYKEMTETMGPCEAGCPARILDKLSPIEAFAEPGTDSHKWATEWRAKCRAALDKKAKAPGHGARIKFASPIKFVDGSTFDTFTIHKSGRRVRFAPEGSTYAVYSISGWKTRDFEVLT